MEADRVAPTGLGAARPPLTGLARAGRFSLVGGVGFAVDAGVLTLLVQGFGLNPYSSRALSFLLAATATWALNRRFAFQDRQTLAGAVSHQYVQYLGAQLVGSLANMAVYAFVLWQWPRWQAIVIVPLAIGAVLGALTNFLLLDRWVFKRKAQRPPSR